ncbi:MAG: 2Fe-2S iron-sulfur cluster-binding protein [Pseudomonadota bacterium]
MPTITVNDLLGNRQEIEVSVGSSLMEALRDANFEDVLALCGGSLSCATCHVHIDRAFVDKLPAQSQDERDLLELSDSVTAESRLSCQIPMTEELDQMTVSLVKVD